MTSRTCEGYEENERSVNVVCEAAIGVFVAERRIAMLTCPSRFFTDADSTKNTELATTLTTASSAAA
ncbi:MAG: hypothetical protein ISQ06_03020 [Planctomycetaceae bacterium]|nr:hypothetical protein [Planctomycetaceae bacterium]